MGIPDESPWGPVPDTVRVEFVDSGEITPELTVGLLADIKQVQRERDAAIARAAQVRILRELAERAERRADQVLLGTNVGSLQRNMHLAYFDEFHARIRELEQPVHALDRNQGRRTDLKKD